MGQRPVVSTVVKSSHPLHVCRRPLTEILSPTRSFPSPVPVQPLLAVRNIMMRFSLPVTLQPALSSS